MTQNPRLPHQSQIHVLELFREAWECPVCLCFFTDPAVLECGHTFCRSCLKHVAESTRTKTNAASSNSNASSTNNSMNNSLNNSAMNASNNNRESANLDNNNNTSAASSTSTVLLLCPTCRLPTAHASLEKIPPNYSLAQTLASVRYCSFCADVCEAYCGACDAFLCHEHKDEHADTTFTKAHVLNGHVVSYAEYTLESRKQQQLKSKGGSATTTQSNSTPHPSHHSQPSHPSHPPQSPHVPPHAPSPSCVPNGCPLHTNPHLADSTSANKPPSHSPNSNNRSPYPYPNHPYPTWAYPPPQQAGLGHWGPYSAPPPGNYPGPPMGGMNGPMGGGPGGMNSSMGASSMGMAGSMPGSGMGGNRG